MFALMVIGIASAHAGSEKIDRADKASRKALKAAKAEVQQRFKAGNPATHGQVVALVAFDSEGCAQVLEMNSVDADLMALVRQRVESKAFAHIKNETIKLVVDFRK